MAKVSVPIVRSNKVAQVENGATVGATVGVNLRWPDGSLVEASDLGGSATAEDDPNSGNNFLLWQFLREVPANVTALQNASGTGLFAVTGSGTGALRSLTVSADLSLSNGNGVAGNPMFGLADLADTGAGAALVKLTRDSKGRISGTSAATTTDLAEGANLYYTDARADARIAAQKGLANGLAPLGSDGKLDTAYLPAAVLGQVDYQGTWDASAGTPPTATPEKGWYYIVTVAGSTDLDGITEWAVGDWAIHSGTAWNKVDNTDAVVTVNGYTGAVTLTAADVGAATAAQGAKADTALQSVVAGANVSIDTTDPHNPVISAAGGSGSGDVVGPASSTDGNVALFDGITGKLLKDGGSFGALVRAVVLTGLSTATSTVIAATDTVLGALGKLQAQITANLLPKGYIDGLRPTFVSATAVTIKSGACYIPGSGKVVRNDSDMALTGLAPGASTWAHLYVYESAGVLAAELSTTAPATPYNGTARCKTGDTTRRYVGSVLTDASGNIYKWLNDGDAVLWENSIAGAPFFVLNAGRATTATNVACAGSVPVTAKVGILIMATLGTADAAAGNADMTGALTTSSYLQYVGSGVQTTHFMPLDSSQRFNYLMTATVTSGGFYARVCGFILER